MDKISKKVQFFSKYKRRIIQVLSMLIYNADIKNWQFGSISRLKTKNVCVPGLNCYSCPGAIASCPIGSIQNTLANGRFPFFVTGFLLLCGTLLGRAVCSFLCPVGFVQELLYKIPFFKIKKTSRSLKISRTLSLTKYFILFGLCIIPFAQYLINGLGQTVFCKYLCPAGTVGAGWPLVILQTSFQDSLGILFWQKTIIAILLIVLSIICFRPFCKYLCPLGAFYSFFNKSTIFGIKLDKAKCTNCGACTSFCKMDVKEINDRECIRCGECKSVCKANAIR